VRVASRMLHEFRARRKDADAFPSTSSFLPHRIRFRYLTLSYSIFLEGDCGRIRCLILKEPDLI
jgi:hypothetical protein